MKRVFKVHGAIGETRVGLIENGRLVEVHIERDRDRLMPHAGDVFTGQVRRIDAGMGAAFVDLGTGEDGFLRFTTSPGAPRMTEGMRIDVKVRREGEAGKGPILVYKGKPTLETQGAVEQSDLLGRLSARYPDATVEEGSIPRLSELVEVELAIPGGGTLSIEPTRALVAVDVDKGSQVSGLKVGLAAAKLIAQQLRLRGLGGLVCVDFPNLRQPKQKKQLEKAVEAAFADDPDKPKIAPLSRFGVLEMTRMRRARSLDALLAETPLETNALEALERLVAEGRARPGAQLKLLVPEVVTAWLETTDLDWRSALTERLGARWVVETGEKTDVEADR